MPGMDDILGFAKLFESASGLIRATRADWRNAAARYLRRVADCLGAIETELGSGRLPERQFASLASYARKMPKTVVNIVGKTEADRLRAALVAADSARHALAKPEAKPATRDAFRTAVARAAGELEAAADIVEAS